jgi:hypothetical protein
MTLDSEVGATDSIVPNDSQSATLFCRHICQQAELIVVKNINR